MLPREIVEFPMYELSPPFQYIWVPSPRDGQNWGTPYGDAVGSIVPDFPGMGSASSDLGVVALVCPKMSRGAVFPGGVPFWGKWDMV